jgi:hypothetical protein
LSNEETLIPIESIERAILFIRGQKVMLDADLAQVYGVSTKRLNEQVKRNRDRFPPDFMFQLTDQVKAEVVANCDHLLRLKFSPVPPYAFTEHGAIMAASVLNSERAIQVSVFVVRAFIRLREMVSTHQKLSRRLAELEKDLVGHDEQIQMILKAIKQLMEPSEKASKKIGFQLKEKRSPYLAMIRNR